MNADAVEPHFIRSERVTRLVPLPARASVVTGDAAAAHLCRPGRPGALPLRGRSRDLGEFYVTEADGPSIRVRARYVLQVRGPAGRRVTCSFYFPIELVPQAANPATLTFTAKDVAGRLA